MPLTSLTQPVRLPKSCCAPRTVLALGLLSLCKRPLLVDCTGRRRLSEIAGSRFLQRLRIDDFLPWLRLMWGARTFLSRATSLHDVMHSITRCVRHHPSCGLSVGARSAFVSLGAAEVCQSIMLIFAQGVCSHVQHIVKLFQPQYPCAGPLLRQISAGWTAFRQAPRQNLIADLPQRELSCHLPRRSSCAEQRLPHKS